MFIRHILSFLPSHCKCLVLRYSTRALDTEMENLRYMKNSLWGLGEERFKTGTTHVNCYEYLRDPGQTSGHAVENNSILVDWNEIDGIVRDFGTPEFADQASGAIYRYANIEEDKCSQCLRIADEVSTFPVQALSHCLACMASWPSEVQQSLTVRDMVGQIDKTCQERLTEGLIDSAEDQLRMAFMWEALPFHSKCEFPATVLRNLAPQIPEESSISLLVSFLLLASYVQPRTLTDIKVQNIEKTILSATASMAQTELISSYSGLKYLNCGQESLLIKTYLEKHFGLRLA